MGARRLLALLEEVDDDQIIILLSYMSANRTDHAFQTLHERVLGPTRAHLQSSQDDLDRATNFEFARSALVQLGLLRLNFSAPKKGEIPEFDPKTGTVKSRGRGITPLGRLLPRRTGLIGENEY